MQKLYRPGAIGALTDEYEKALNELRTVLNTISDERFMMVIDDSTDDDFRSVRNIVFHIVRSGYVYADHIRKRFGNPVTKNEITINSIAESMAALDKLFKYTVDTFEDKWQLTDDDLMNTIIKTSWTTYDLEAIIEHAIVHILRHRRQIEKLLLIL